MVDSNPPPPDCWPGPLKRARLESSKRPQTRMAQSGTILIREWQGTAHRVTMLDDGVSFNGKRYRSLSEVAARSRAAAGRVRVSLDYDHK